MFGVVGGIVVERDVAGWVVCIVSREAVVSLLLVQGEKRRGRASFGTAIKSGIFIFQVSASGCEGEGREEL